MRRSAKLGAHAQMAAYELGLILPEEQRPLSMDLIRINDTRSDIVPNAGAAPAVNLRKLHFSHDTMHEPSMMELRVLSGCWGSPAKH